ncbi:MAG TPA: hypothetical protein DCE26_00890 [Dehalococcoidia bacterium]|nr:heme-binding protein [SAR202 cluster bacterium]HAA94232.1 hypothetical protein [Dehalococcoidia bacterium]
MLPDVRAAARDFGGKVMASLTLAEAEAVLAGAKAKVVELELKMSISVVDPRGDLITMFRMDGAPWRTPAVSRAKAVSSASFEVPSGSLTDNAQAPIFRGFMAMEGGHMIPGQGALPIFKNGEIVGAVGGSGGTAQEDEDCSRAGIVAAGLSETR